MATNLLYKMAKATSDVLNPPSSNPSNFSGAVDIIIVKHKDGTYKSTPFHVRFGKYMAPEPFNLNVTIKVNKQKLDNLSMTLSKDGIAHFDGPQTAQKIATKEQEQNEQKSEVITTDNGDSQNNIKIKVESIESDKKESSNDSNDSPKEPQQKIVRKRDKLRAFVQSSWSYWSGSENEDENDENAQQKKSKKHKKTNVVTEYITNQLASQWMIEQDVINISNIPSNEMIKLFIDKLKNGKNEILFSIQTASKMDLFQSKMNNKEISIKERSVFANVYLWNAYDQIIISDVDGTITKSDIGGHVLTKIGFDHVQNGIVKILSRLNSSQYKIIYLTARGIGQSSMTRTYLFDELNVPNGAVICSASTTRAALYREVVQKRPQDFKIPTLNNVKNAFGRNPFVGGFGNRDTDAKSYRFFGIDASKIFIIGMEKKKLGVEKGNDDKEKEEEKENEEEEEEIATYIDDYNQIYEDVNEIFSKLELSNDE